MASSSLFASKTTWLKTSFEWVRKRHWYCIMVDWIVVAARSALIHINRQERLFLPLWHDHDRTGCKGDDFLGHAAEQQTRELSSSSPADNDHVGFVFAGGVDDGYGDVAERRFELNVRCAKSFGPVFGV